MRRLRQNVLMPYCCLLGLTLFLMVMFGSSYLAKADRAGKIKPMRTITAYTTLPVEHTAVLSEDYEEATKVRVNFINLTSAELLQRLRQEVKATADGVKPANAAALVLADSETLDRAAGLGYLSPYVSEAEDAVALNLKQPDGFWTGTWYDPIVFCVNRNYLGNLAQIPHGWEKLAADRRSRIGLTDFLAADASSNLFFSMVGEMGDNWTMGIWRQIHPRVVQYAKFLVSPVRQAGMGEVDISVAVQSETLRYINEGYPLKIIYPEEGTSYLLTGEGIPIGLGAEQEAAAKEFADWLLTDDAQIALQRNGFYFMPTNPATMAYKTFAGKNLTLFGSFHAFEANYKHNLLDTWVKEVRLGGV